MLALSACEDLGLESGEQPPLSAEEVNPVRQALAAGVSVEEANAALARKDYDTAYDKLRQYLILNPSDDGAKISLARTYLGRNEGLNAQTILDSLSEEARDSAEVGMLRGLALLIEGERVEAAGYLVAALAEDPTLWQSANGLGLISDFDQRWDEAEANYKRALEAKSDASVVHNNLGYSYLLQGRVDEATEAFATSLTYEPGLAVARSNLRLALAAKGRYTDAIAGADRANLPQVLNNIGYVAMSRGDFESADIFFHRAIDESPVYYDTAEENLERLQTLVGKPVEERRMQSIVN
ncbi:MAG: tetratricopeptide repeat protein [Alphaproteobacteria bacterium]|nr:tetratricopeptide repeat protein [Alphaproteobacteria bacterium]